MKYLLNLLIVVLLVLSGCVILPKPVDEVYLSEMTEAENANLDKIGADIIARKKDKDKIEKELEIITQRIVISQKEIAALEAENEMLLEKEKLYSQTGENSKIVDIQSQKEKNRVRLIQVRTLLKYYNVKRDEANALLSVKKAELAEKVAELDYEKASIAKTYQLKRAEEFGDDIIDDQEYKKFMEDQQVKLNDSKKKYEKAAGELAKAEKELKKTGYEAEK